MWYQTTWQADTALLASLQDVQPGKRRSARGMLMLTFQKHRAENSIMGNHITPPHFSSFHLTCLLFLFLQLVFIKVKPRPNPTRYLENEGFSNKGLFWPALVCDCPYLSKCWNLCDECPRCNARVIILKLPCIRELSVKIQLSLET